MWRHIRRVREGAPGNGSMATPTPRPRAYLTNNVSVDWNQVKDTVAPWWQENPKEAYSSGLSNLATALI